MIELSLHILDLIENSINAGANEIRILLDINEETDLLTLIIEDNGKGFSVDEEQLFDPFYTTKKSKIVGMGLSLAKGSAERAGGDVVIGKSEDLGGARVALTFVLSNIDRMPVGDLGNSIAGMFITNPNINMQIYIIHNTHTLLSIHTGECRERFSNMNDIEIYKLIENEINNIIKTLKV
ncbi:MAG: ATP-binding protein [Candidatus Hydrogenedens sp.]